MLDTFLWPLFWLFCVVSELWQTYRSRRWSRKMDSFVKEVEETKGYGLTELAEPQEEIWKHRYPDGC